MMTKTTSQSRALLKKIAVLPVLAGLIFISCSKKATEKSMIEAKVVEVQPGEKFEAKKLNGSEAFTSVQVLPEFPGGMKAFGEYVAKEFKIPSELKQSGNILASFIVETDGSLTDIKIIKDLGSGTKEEATQLLRNSPKWLPGQQDDKIVRVAYNLPIRISLEKK